jgi:hypothetical protein
MSFELQILSVYISRRVAEGANTYMDYGGWQLNIAIVPSMFFTHSLNLRRKLGTFKVGRPPGSYPPQLERFEDGLLNLKCCVTSAFP